MANEGTYVVHHGNSITSWRTVDGSYRASTRDAAVEHPEGTLMVTGEQEKLAERLEAWRRAGLMTDEQFKQRILSSGRILTLRELNEAHRIKLVTSSKATRDHDVVDTPIRTLHDLNMRHRACFAGRHA